MFRMQLYLTEFEKNELDIITRKTGESRSLLIRKAVDNFLSDQNNVEKKLLSAFGIWKDYDFDYQKIRNNLE